MKRSMLVAFAAIYVLSAGRAQAVHGDLSAVVKARETAFAKTMADRNLQAFSAFISKEGVFFGGKGPARGRAAVVEVWKRFFDGPDAPFSWAPETAEVLSTGKLALTSGPVHDPTGELIGTFTTIWRLESDGKWRVVFDKGCDVCKPVVPDKTEPEKAAEPEKTPETKQ